MRGTIQPSRPEGRGRDARRRELHPRPHGGLSLRPLIHAGIFAAIFVVVAVIGLFPVSAGNAALDPQLNVSQLTFPGLAASAPLVAQTEFTAAPQPLTVRAPDVSEGTLLGAEDFTEAELETRALAADNASIDVEDAETQSARRVAMYRNYVVQDGDTLTSIATDFGLDTNYIIWNNTDIDNPNRLSPGVQIIVPYVAGIVHPVEYDETLTDIARRYDAQTEDILAFDANSLSDPNQLTADTLIFVPGGRIVPKPAPSIRPGASAAPPVLTGEWGWPAGVQGLLTSPFGPSHWLGIDLAMPVGTPIYAVRPGVVLFAGGDPWVSYGYYVKVDHGGEGWETTYAHLDSFAPGIGNGTPVNQGDLLGYSGNTGNSTGPHLHFETRWWGEPQNPMDLLQ